jgi:hypothetical protein
VGVVVGEHPPERRTITMPSLLHARFHPGPPPIKYTHKRKEIKSWGDYAKSSEVALAMGVLENAVDCLNGIVVREKGGMGRLDIILARAQAYEWIFHKRARDPENKEYIFTFENICEIIDINPVLLRQVIQRVVNFKIIPAKNKRVMIMIYVVRNSIVGEYLNEKDQRRMGDIMIRRSGKERGGKVEIAQDMGEILETRKGT